MVRFYDCQFGISSHSPFILSLPYARIYIWMSILFHFVNGQNFRTFGFITSSSKSKLQILKANLLDYLGNSPKSMLQIICNPTKSNANVY